MKKIIAVLLVVALLLVGCNKAPPHEEEILETSPEFSESLPATYEEERTAESPEFKASLPADYNGSGK